MTVRLIFVYVHLSHSQAGKVREIVERGEKKKSRREARKRNIT